MKNNAPFIAILLLLSIVPQAHAEQGNPGSTPWYTIELVLFTRNSSPGASGEIWSKASREEAWNNERTADYSLVPAGNWRLSDAKLALKGSHEGLTPVIHTAWRQPVFSRNSARSFYLKSDREITSGTPLVEGMVKVSVSRYLHVDLDLIMHGTADAGAGLLGEFQTFRFDEHRRMRSKELHYIDHPLMGMLILITPLNSAEPQSLDDGDSQELEGQAISNEPLNTD